MLSTRCPAFVREFTSICGVMPCLPCVEVLFIADGENEELFHQYSLGKIRGSGEAWKTFGASKVGSEVALFSSLPVHGLPS